MIDTLTAQGSELGRVNVVFDGLLHDSRAAVAGFSDKLAIVDDSHTENAKSVRSLIENRLHDRLAFRAALMHVPPMDRDAWLDVVLGLDGLPPDGPDLPTGCVPYLPCSVDVLLRMVEQARILPTDVFVDLGSGAGRAATLVHLLTNASVIGIEIQSALVAAARDLATRLHLARIAFTHGDAVKLTAPMNSGSVFFLYCPFSGDRLAKVVANLEPLARTQMIRICCVDLPPLAYPWLTAAPSPPGDLTIYQSTLHAAPRGFD